MAALESEPEVTGIDIVEDEAAHRAAKILQARVRGKNARRQVDDLRQARVDIVVQRMTFAMQRAQEEAQDTFLGQFEVKNEVYYYEHHDDDEKKLQKSQEHEMSTMTVKNAMKKLEELQRTPWTQRNSFNIAVAFVIFVNAVTMGVEADYGETHPFTFLILEHAFTAIFFAELLCHWLVVGPRGYFRDHMNWLDFSLVMVSVVDVWIISPIGIDADLRMMSLFRMLRLIRLARLLRLLRMFKELTLLVNGFVASFRTLFWALVFLSIMVYIFSIFARQTIGNFKGFNEDVSFGDDARLFGSVDKTMLTLFVCLTEGCGMDVIHPTVLDSPALIIFWATFVFFTTYGLLNLIVGCFCENAMKIANENEKEILESRDQKRMHILRHMKVAFNSMDSDHTGNISKKEFTTGIMSNRTVMNALTQLGLDSEENLFEILDSDNQGVITFDQFFDGASLIMKGQETAKAKDIVSTQLTTRTIQRKVKNMDLKVDSLRKDMGLMHKKMDKMNSSLSMLLAACNVEGSTANPALLALSQPTDQRNNVKSRDAPGGTSMVTVSEISQQQPTFPPVPGVSSVVQVQVNAAVQVDPTRVIEHDDQRGTGCGNHKCLEQVPFLPR